MHDLTIAIVCVIVSGFLTHWFDRHNPPTQISLVAPTAQDDQRTRLTSMRQLVRKMWNEANYHEPADLKKDAISFRDDYDSDAVGFDNPDNLELIFGNTRDGLSEYIAQCGTEQPERKPESRPNDDRLISCAEITQYYLKPSLESLSLALQKRLDKMK